MDRSRQREAGRWDQYYSKIKGDWNGPSPRQFSKMKKSKFLDLLKGREEIEREILLTFSTLNQDHVTEDHVDGRHVTEDITAEDHGDGHHVTDTTAAQQQPGDPGPAGEFNTNRQDHGMIDIEELLNDWLGEAV